MVNVVKVIDAGKGYTTILADDGNTYRLVGARNWRNNNPGNIEYGKFARSMGAVGTDGRFAVFPTLESGTAAQQHLQFESPAYKNLTVLQAINKYAPPSENNSTAYAKAVANAAGVSLDTPMSSLTPSQRSAFMAAQQQVEGFRAGQQTLVAQGAPRSDFTTMAQANQQAASMPPLPRPRPPTPNGGTVIGANTGQTFQVGQIVNSPDGVHKLLVQDDGTGHAKFVRQLNPGEVPGVFDPYKAVGADKTPSLLGDFINSRPDIAGPLQMAKGMGLTANQAAQFAANPPKISAAPVQQAVQNVASATQSTVGNAVKQGTSALGDFGNSAMGMLGGLFGSQKPAAPPPSVPSVPANSGWSTAWGAAPMPVPKPATPLPAPPPVYSPTMPVGGPGTFAPAGLPAAPYMPTMPIGGPGTFGAAGMPAAPVLPFPSPLPLAPQIGTPPGTQLHMTTNPVRRPAPQYIPPPMATIATGKRVPVGTVTPHGGVVQANGSINHGSWSTPGPGQDLKWWQANSMGYTV